MISILLILIIALAATILLLLVAPIRFSAFLSIKALTPESGLIRCEWLHPSLFSFGNDFTAKTAWLRLPFWRRTWGGDAQPTGAQNTESSGESSAAFREEKHSPKTPEQQTSAPSPAPEEKPPVQPPSSSAVPREEHASTPPEEERGTSRFRMWWHRIDRTRSILRRLHLLAKITRWFGLLLRTLLKVIVFDRVKLHARIGVDDPSIMGRIYGWTSAARAALPVSRQERFSISVDPDFAGPTLVLDGSLVLRTSPARLLLPVVVALCTFPWLSSWLAWRRLIKVYSSPRLR